MNCIFCGAELKPDDKLCPTCGSLVTTYASEVPALYASPSPVTPVEPVAVPLSKWPDVIDGFSMKWFNLFARTIVWLWLIGGTLLFGLDMYRNITENYAGSLASYYSDPDFGVYNILSMIGFVGMTTLMVVARFRLVEFKKIGYLLIQIFWVARVVWPMLSALFVTGDYPIEVTLSLVFQQNLLYIGLSLASFIYFYKRKLLFKN